MRVDPETGTPDPDLDVADVSGEATSLRRAVKQVKDAKWNLEKARDDASDDARKEAYKIAADDLDKMHGTLSPIYDELRRGGAQPRVRGVNVAERSVRGSSTKREQSPPQQPDSDVTVGPDSAADADGNPGGITYDVVEARARGRKLLREAHGTLDAVVGAQWFRGPSTWTPTIEFVPQGDYGLGDAARGVVRAVAGDARSIVHPNEVAEIIAQAVSALYAEGRATDYRWHGHTTGMPDELGEGLIVTQEEVYWAVRRLSGDNAATPEYLDEVYKEIYRLGLRVATRRPNTLERSRHTP
jgi:hypothetical protein